MHELCIECHKERAAELGRPQHGECATCHHHAPGADAAILAHLRQRHELSLRNGDARNE
jgi:hypothetical protein